LGKLALVTGASRGIGAATAEALAAAGAHVILTARMATGLEEVEERIHNAGGSATIAPLDLADNDAIARLGVAISGRWQALSPVPHLEAKEFTRVMQLNVNAQQAMLAAFDPMLRASGDARVIGVTSSAGHAPFAYWGGYGASKAAFEMLLGCYVEETRNLGRIRIAIVDPGRTRTAMRARAYPGEDPATVKEPRVVGERLAALAAEDFETGHRERVN
jgi:short-subunit dehydrogenase